MELYERVRWAEDLFERRDYLTAAQVLEELLRDVADEPRQVQHGLTAARLLLARASFHAARLGPAEDAARALLAENPTDAYAALLLARTLERRSRQGEADGALKLATALGAPRYALGDNAGSVSGAGEARSGPTAGRNLLAGPPASTTGVCTGAGRRLRRRRAHRQHRRRRCGYRGHVAIREHRRAMGEAPAFAAARGVGGLRGHA